MVSPCVQIDCLSFVRGCLCIVVDAIIQEINNFSCIIQTFVISL